MRWPRPRYCSAPISSHSVLRASCSAPSACAARCRDSGTAAGRPSRRRWRTCRCAGAQTRSRRSAGASIADLGQRGERHPDVAAVDHRLEHRAEARVGVGDPFEGLPSSVPAVAGAAPRASARSLRRELDVAARVGLQRLDQRRDPGLRLAEDHRRRLAGEDGLAHDFALERLAVGVDHRQRRRDRARRTARAASARAATGRARTAAGTGRRAASRRPAARAPAPASASSALGGSPAASSSSAAEMPLGSQADRTSSVKVLAAPLMPSVPCARVLDVDLGEGEGDASRSASPPASTSRSTPTTRALPSVMVK